MEWTCLRCGARNPGHHTTEYATAESVPCGGCGQLTPVLFLPPGGRPSCCEECGGVEWLRWVTEPFGEYRELTEVRRVLYLCAGCARRRFEAHPEPGLPRVREYLTRRFLETAPEGRG